MSLTTDETAVGVSDQAGGPAGLRIRRFDFSDADYEAIVAIGNAASPDYPSSVEELRHGDRTRLDYIKRQRLIAELDGVPVGVAGYGQAAGMYHPQKFFIHGSVLPAQQGRGIARALYTELIADLEQYQPIALRNRVREDRTAAVHFLTERGFVEEDRAWESRLDVRSFDPTPFTGRVERVLAQGIRIVTLGELMDRDPDHRRKLYELDCEATQDEPMPEPFTPPGQEAYDKWIFDNPNLRPAGFFVAVDGDRYAGLSSLFGNQAEPQVLSVGFTGVGRDYRRRGIALALKLCTLNYARAAGATTIKTWNDSTNRPMLSINEALGFVKQPAWVGYLKTIHRE